MNLVNTLFSFDVSLSGILSPFMVLFAVIDIIGSIPLIIDLKRKSGSIEAAKISFVAFIILFIFLLLGEQILGLFGVDISSFAIAGSFILFFLALEMVLGVEFFKKEGNIGPSIFPIAFPLIAGAGSFTTILSLRAEYSFVSIGIALALNLLVVYLVLKLTNRFEKILGEVGILIMRKMFGIILLAISIKLFLSNTGIELNQ